MIECGFLHPDNTPTDEAAQSLPVDVPHMSKEGEKRILWFHDESAYNTTKDTPVLWGGKGKLPIKPKGKGPYMMVSEFIEEKDGYLALSDQQYELEEANSSDDVEKSALAVLEIRENFEGYWTGEHFMEQLTKVVKVTKVKYPISQGYHHIWCFDHSYNHTAFAEDALITSKMNKDPGGKQRKMQGTVWNGLAQPMTLLEERPKGAALGLKSVSKENITNYEHRCRNYVCIFGGISSWTRTRRQDQILQVSEPHITGGMAIMIGFCDNQLLRRNIRTYIHMYISWCKEEEMKQKVSFF